MKKIALLVALVVMTIFASAQTKQYFWLDGKLMFGTQIASTDSLTYGRENADSMMLYLPRTVTRTVTVHDTITQLVHDTVIQTIAVHDTVTVIVHDTIYNSGNNPKDDLPVNSGMFSIAANTQVQFSPGNLQYQASTDTWRFAENQYDYIGADNANISASYSSWIDLFGWGTGNNPTNTSTSISDYSAFVDWGRNAISNCGNVAGQWRTLTNDEWVYLFETRTNAGSLYGMGSVYGVNGLILLPDDWTQPSGITFVDGSSNKNFSANTYTSAQWELLENAGAVFLPAAGYREGTSVGDIGSYGNYWSSTTGNSSGAYNVGFSSGNLNPQRNHSRDYCYSVRLVR